MTGKNMIKRGFALVLAVSMIAGSALTAFAENEVLETESKDVTEEMADAEETEDASSGDIKDSTSGTVEDDTSAVSGETGSEGSEDGTVENEGSGSERGTEEKTETLPDRSEMSSEEANDLTAVEEKTELMEIRTVDGELVVGLASEVQVMSGNEDLVRAAGDVPVQIRELHGKPWGNTPPAFETISYIDKDGNGLGSHVFQMSTDGGRTWNFCYCCNPNKIASTGGQLSSPAVADRLLKVLYYGYGGYGDITGFMGDNGTEVVNGSSLPRVTSQGFSQERYFVTHMAAAFVLSGEWNCSGLTGNAVSRANLTRFIQTIDSKPSPGQGGAISLSKGSTGLKVENGKIRTDDITMKTGSNVTYTLPAGYTLYKNGNSQANPSPLKTGDVFHLEAKIPTDGKIPEGTVTFDGSTTTYLLVAAPTAEHQTMAGYGSVTTPEKTKLGVGANSVLEIRKSSTLPEISTGNSCYSLNGAEYTICYNGTDIQAGKITTDDKGYGKLDKLPAGKYDILETKAPKGFLLDTKVHTVTLTDSATFTFDHKDEPGNDPVVVRLKKQDSDTVKSQAKASLKGAEYTFLYYDVVKENDPARDGDKPLYAWVFRTDEDGILGFDDAYLVSGDDIPKNANGIPTLPLGTLTIKETKAPEGYLISDEIYVINTTMSNNDVETKNLPTEGLKAEEDIIAADLEFIKIDAETERPMADIPFRITSKTNGEEHVIVSDKDGMIHTGAVPHSQNTNNGKTAEDGIYFGKGEVDDERGALLFDDYIVRELPCKNNMGKDLVEFEISIVDEQTVKVFPVENKTIILKTTATAEATESKTMLAKEGQVIKDTVMYDNLTVGRTYTLKGKLVDKTSGEVLTINDEEVTAEKSFDPEQENGSVEMEFTFDATGLEGSTYVVFEELYWDDDLIQSHSDLNDEDQTVYVPEIATKASDDKTGDNVGTVEKAAKVIDTVSYKGLTPGREYKAAGVLMDKKTGEKLFDAEGNEITSELVFTPEEPSGSVKICFDVDSTNLLGESVVAFETLYDRDIEIAVHSDIEDEDQSIDYPKIGTTAKDLSTKDSLVSVGPKTTIIDTVTYENLRVGEEYTLRGILVDASSGDRITAGGKYVEAEETFTAENKEGSIEIRFEFDATSCQGMDLVAFEALTHSDVLVAEHADIKDEAQTVILPGLRTTASDGTTGNHTGAVGTNVKVRDTVYYENLIPGREYTVTGKLMVREGGKAFMLNGKEMTKQLKFKPESADGSVEIVFEIDSTSLEGKTLVVFETLAWNGVDIVTHADLKDEAQSIHYPVREVPPVLTKNPPKTGDGSRLMIYSLLIMFAAAGVMGCIYFKKRKR